MTEFTILPTRVADRPSGDDVPTTLALVKFELLRGSRLVQVESLRIAYTDQEAAHKLAAGVLEDLLRANPDTFGTFTLSWL